VREGVTVSLARVARPGATPNVISPLHTTNTITPDGDVTWFLDSLTWLFHGWGFSHMDAISHTMYRGRLYNGVQRSEVTVTSGATRLGIDVARQGIVTRAVLVDVPRLKGVPYLEPGAVITTDDIVAWEKQTGIRVESGDVLLIRTGRWAREKALGVWDVTKSAAGPHPSLALWLHARGVSALGGDVSNERYPPLVAGLSDPLHELALVGMGMPFFDALDFEELARVAAAKSRWAFLFVVAPLVVLNGSGSPVNPLAIF
jgi:kynurenine formamidase